MKKTKWKLSQRTQWSYNLSQRNLINLTNRKANNKTNRTLTIFKTKKTNFKNTTTIPIVIKYHPNNTHLSINTHINLLSTLPHNINQFLHIPILNSNHYTNQLILLTNHKINFLHIKPVRISLHMITVPFVIKWPIQLFSKNPSLSLG